MKTETHHMAGVAPTGTEVQPEQCAEPRAPAEVRLPMLEQQEPGPGVKERLGGLASGIGQIRPVEPPVKVRPERSYERPLGWFD